MSFYNFKVKDIKGTEKDLSDFKGKPALIVNVASKCGFTPQYEGLQKLFEKFEGKVHVLGFPCNQFGKQEPGTTTLDISVLLENNLRIGHVGDGRVYVLFFELV